MKSIIYAFLLVITASSTATASSDCLVSRDSNGHVHLKSDSHKTALKCWGYVHATDRLWQMDYFRRVAQGRTAEVHGYFKLRTDFMMRLMGLYELAEKISQNLDPETREWLELYAEGVNSVIRQFDPKEHYEFKRLGYKPEMWQVKDSVSLILLQSFDQTRKTFMSEIEESERIQHHKDEKLKNFSDHNTPWETTILKPGEYEVATSAVASHKEIKMNSYSLSSLIEFFAPLNSELSGIGSNNWVIAPSRSATGNAWLVNDPHLNLRNPAFWHWSHIQSPEVNTMGAAFPGIPVITSGFNENVAWGLTNAYLDMGKLAYVSKDELIQTQKHRPWIWIKFWFVKVPMFFKTFERTTSGLPILPLDAPPGKALVLRWTGLALTAENIAPLKNLNHATTALEAKNTLQKLNLPSWNFVSADNKGNIIYTATGSALEHKILTPRGVSELKLKELETHPTLTVDKLPQLENPKRAYVVTANNRHWPKDALYSGGNDYRTGFRAHRIEELLLKTQKHTLDTHKAMVCDIQAVDAKYFVPEMVKILLQTELSESLKAALTLLQEWNFITDLDCKACAIYRRTIERLEQKMKADDVAVYHWLTSTASDRAEVLKSEMESAIGELKVATGENFPTWKIVHRNYFRHISEDKRFFHEDFLATPGDEHTVNPGTANWERTHYEQKSGASHRIIVELSQPIKVYAQLAGSNQNIERPDFTNDSSEWVKWNRCEFTEVQFPYDWPSNAEVIKL